MKKKILIFGMVFLVLTSFSIGDMFSKKTYVYVTSGNNSVAKSKWIIKTKDEKIIIEKNSDAGITNIVYLPGFKLSSFSYISSDLKSDYQLFLSNKKLVAQGKSKGRSFSKTHNLSYPWIQDFNFGLRNLLTSKSTEQEFTLLNPSDFSVNEMVATKKNIEKIKIDDTTYNTQKVEVTLQGFKSMFWKAEIWYDLQSLDLVKYKSNEGPGTPFVVISLEEKKE
ncbi:MAG: hypothetical protein WCT85_01265 [Parachlamydiales bacterium]